MRYNRYVVNLLPKKDIKKVVWEHRRRVLVVSLIFLAFSMVLAILFVVPSLIVVWSAANGYEDQLAATKILVDLQRKQGGSDVLTDAQQKTDLLEEALLQRTPTSILQEVSPLVPRGVEVKQFAYSWDGAENGASVSVKGTSDTRSSLIEFGDSLRQSDLFSRVEVPVSSLAKSNDIDFTLTLHLEPLKEVPKNNIVVEEIVEEAPILSEETSETESSVLDLPAESEDSGQVGKAE